MAWNKMEDAPKDRHIIVALRGGQVPFVSQAHWVEPKQGFCRYNVNIDDFEPLPAQGWMDYPETPDWMKEIKSHG